MDHLTPDQGPERTHQVEVGGCWFFVRMDSHTVQEVGCLSDDPEEWETYILDHCEDAIVDAASQMDLDWIAENRR